MSPDDEVERFLAESQEIDTKIEGTYNTMRREILLRVEKLELTSGGLTMETLKKEVANHIHDYRGVAALKREIAACVREDLSQKQEIADLKAGSARQTERIEILEGISNYHLSRLWGSINETKNVVREILESWKKKSYIDEDRIEGLLSRLTPEGKDECFDEHFPEHCNRDECTEFERCELKPKPECHMKDPAACQACGGIGEYKECEEEQTEPFDSHEIHTCNISGCTVYTTSYYAGMHICANHLVEIIREDFVADLQSRLEEAEEKQRSYPARTFKREYWYAITVICKELIDKYAATPRQGAGVKTPDPKPTCIICDPDCINCKYEATPIDVDPCRCCKHGGAEKE